MATYTKTTLIHKKEFNEFVKEGKICRDIDLFITEFTPEILTPEELDYAIKCIRKYHKEPKPKKTNSDDESTPNASQTTKPYYPPTKVEHKEAFNAFIQLGKASTEHEKLILNTTTSSIGLSEEELRFAINTINKYHRLNN